MYTTKFRSLFPSILETNDLSDLSLDKLFESISDRSTGGSYRTEKTESGWLLKLALPGVSKNEVEISTDENKLVIEVDSENGWIKKSKKTLWAAFEVTSAPGMSVAALTERVRRYQLP